MTRRALLVAVLLACLPSSGDAADIGTTLTILPQIVTDVVESDDKQVHQAGTFTIQLVSPDWELVPGITVRARLLESKDNGQTWTVLAGMVTQTGTLPPPPRDAMPSITVSHPSAKGSRRLRVDLSVSAPLVVGATVIVDGTQ